MRLWSRANSRTCASEGAGPVACASALATAIEDPLGVGQAQVATAHEHRQVIEHVSALLGDPLVGLLPDRARDLLGLLLDLGAGERRIVEEGDGVGARRARAGPVVDRALQRAQNLRGRLRL